MSAEYVRRMYGVDYKIGDRLTVDGRAGRLVSFPKQHLGVRLDGDKLTSLCHPTWRVSREKQLPEGWRLIRLDWGLLVIGTDQITPASKLLPDWVDHWSGSEVAYWVRRNRTWHGRPTPDEYPRGMRPPKDARPGVVFTYPSEKKVTA